MLIKTLSEVVNHFKWLCSLLNTIIPAYFEQSNFPYMYNTYYLFSQQTVIHVYLHLQSTDYKHWAAERPSPKSLNLYTIKWNEGNINSENGGSLLLIHSYFAFLSLSGYYKVKYVDPPLCDRLWNWNICSVSKNVFRMVK